MINAMRDYRVATRESARVTWNELHVHPAKLADVDAVVVMFGALHRYNASLDAHFALADDWETLLRREFGETWQQPDRLWLLVKQGNQAAGLLTAAVHTDSPIFRHRRWVEVEALYVSPAHRGMGIAGKLLSRAYQWAEAQGLSRVQLYVTASNVRAQSVYADQGFTVAQAIMRKSL